MATLRDLQYAGVDYYKHGRGVNAYANKHYQIQVDERPLLRIDLEKSKSTVNEKLSKNQQLRRYNNVDKPLIWTSNRRSQIIEPVDHQSNQQIRHVKHNTPLNHSNLQNKYPSLQSINSNNTFLSKQNPAYHSFRDHSNTFRVSSSVNRIICVRHGERVDFVFGGNWTHRAFDKKGAYKRTNLNLPIKLPARINPVETYKTDCPLTEIGAFQARLTGQALQTKMIPIDLCFASPALRCIQTADNILRGMGLDRKVAIKIEPGLFEYLKWYDKGVPTFMSPKELRSIGYNIDVEYTPFLRVKDLNMHENHIDFYNRSFRTTLYAVNSIKKPGSNILLCGHAPTLDVCTRQLCGQPPRSYQDLNAISREVSYLAMTMCERGYFDKMWIIKEPPVPPLNHVGNSAFNFHVLI